MGTVVRLTKLTESSLIVHWCTFADGIVKTVAKGGRRQKGSFAGKLDLFVEAEIVWQPSRSSELHALREVEVLDYREGLRKIYGQTLAATYFCQLVEMTTEPGVEIGDFAGLLKRGLDYLNGQVDVRAVRFFEKEMAKLLGVASKERTAANSLREHCGDLPRTREELMNLLEI